MPHTMKDRLLKHNLLWRSSWQLRWFMETWNCSLKTLFRTMAFLNFRAKIALIKQDWKNKKKGRLVLLMIYNHSDFSLFSGEFPLQLIKLNTWFFPKVIIASMEKWEKDGKCRSMSTVELCSTLLLYVIFDLCRAKQRCCFAFEWGSPLHSKLLNLEFGLNFRFPDRAVMQLWGAWEMFSMQA